MIKADLEKLIMSEFLLELSLIDPGIKEVKSESELESYIESNFNEKQRVACFIKSSNAIMGGLLNQRSRF